MLTNGNWYEFNSQAAVLIHHVGSDLHATRIYR